MMVVLDRVAAGDEHVGDQRRREQTVLDDSGGGADQPRQRVASRVRRSRSSSLLAELRASCDRGRLDDLDREVAFLSKSGEGQYP
ncbi:hypothetical protein [Streptomyces sp. NPDC001410]|uniref:hypothetical protein n=1 Tax=Streptomyces sp. NPDC001410 TaxID=3364574 RepID=UPI0036CE34D8